MKFLYRPTDLKWLLNGGLVLFRLVCLCTAVMAQTPKSADYTNQSLEELMNLEVISASKKEEKLFNTAAAVYVISSEEIRRSGMTSLPELLRLVPGLQVARIDGSKYAITARGFNMRYANKLLVLVDGRSIYSPVHAGVYWEIQNIPLEEIERIEVVRGPGGTLWGANAVNGVINIITKKAEESQGVRMTTGGGIQELGVASVRVGSKLAQSGHFKFYGQYNKRGELLALNGLTGARDSQLAGRGGFRFDWQDKHRNEFSLQGEIFNTSMHETSTHVTYAAPLSPLPNTLTENHGGFVLARWQHTDATGNQSALKLYFDRSGRNSADVSERVDTYDADWQQRRVTWRRHDLIWGAGFRHVVSITNTNKGTPVQFWPTGRTLNIYSGFAQDDIQLRKEKVRLTVGAKVEHNPYSKFEFQPNVRLLWTPTGVQTFWLAASGAVRTPVRVTTESRVNYGGVIGPFGVPVLATLFGQTTLKPEELRAFEGGYRAQVKQRLTIDFATYYNTYDRLFNFEPGNPYYEIQQNKQLIIYPYNLDNKMRGESYGAEISANLELTRFWQLRGSYTNFNLRLHPKAGSRDAIYEYLERDIPRNQFQLHSFLSLPGNFEFDTALYHVSRMPRINVAKYARLDVRVGWRWRQKMEFSLAGQNLLDPAHREAGGSVIFVQPSQVRRSVFGKVTWYR